ncbi:MAG: Do family serine endopeptidase [Candidatus Omnitrophota bacterium]
MGKYIISLVVCILISLPLYAQGVSELEKATIDVAASGGKSVVSISSVIKEKIGSNFYFGSPSEGFDDPFQQFFGEFFGGFPEREYERRGLGSGVIVDKEGYILTNEHVISGASEVKVKLSDGREFDAEIKGADKRSDLAVIKIDAKGLPEIKLGNSDDLQIGKWVVAIGNPFGFAIDNPEPTVTVGVISALNRYLPALGRRDRGYDDLIQTDAAINPGNSGGPLVNLKGEIIGINTAIITTSGGYQGVGFAIPINKAKKILDKLFSGEKILYGWLGVTIDNLNDDLRNYFEIKERVGIIVLKVYKDSPAEESGLKEGDLILAFDGESVKTTRDLVRMVSASSVGKRIPLEVLRNGKEIKVLVKIGKMPKEGEEIEEAEDASDKVSFRGMAVDDLTPFYQRRFGIKAEQGVVITDIEDDSAADKTELEVGDVVLKIENKQIDSKEEFVAVTSKVKGNCLIKTNRGYSVLKAK